jgi:predicted nucleic-acid-binding protein
MIGIDTSVMVRYLVIDNEGESARASALIDEAATRGEHLFVPHLVLSETATVLERAYGVPREEVCTLLRGLVASRQLHIEAPAIVNRAIAGYQKGRGDLADYLIREHARMAGCDAVVTFDRVVLGDSGFTSP